MNSFRALRHALLSASFAAVAVTATAAEADLTALRAKAEKGNAIAQYNLGLAYAEGRDVAVDRSEAYVWLSLALENGARGRALEALTAQFTPAELAAAKARLAERRGARSSAPAVAATPAPAAPEADNTLAEAQADKKQLSTELAAAWKEADQLKAELEKTRATAANAAEAEQLRRERDALSSKITDLAGEIASLRADRERLQKLAAQTQRDISDARDSGRGYQEQLRASEQRILELVRQTEQLKGELERAQQSIAALKSPAPSAPVDNAELIRKSRELEAALADLENSRNASLALSSSLAKANDDRAGLEKMLAQAQSAALVLSKQVDDLTAQADQQKTAAPSAPAYPDLRERVADLEAQVSALRNAPPAYPDLRDRVSQLETQLAAAANVAAAPSAPAITYPDLRDRVAALEGQLAEANRRADTLDTRHTALANAKSATDAELQNFTARLGNAQQEAAIAQEKLAQLTAANRELNLQVAAAGARPSSPAYPDLREQVAELQQQLAAAKSAVPSYPDLRPKVETLEAQLASLANRADRTPAYPDLRERVADLESQVSALRNAPPAYPDLRERVGQLESQLASTATRASAPSYPDLSPRVAQLESALATAEAQLAAGQRSAAAPTPTATAPTEDVEALKEKLATAEDKLATALSGYSQLQKELDALQASSAKSTSDLGSERDSLAGRLAASEAAARSAQDEVTRLNETVTVLQRSGGQSTSELAATRALLKQMQGAQELLAKENYQLKAALAGAPVVRDAALTAAAASIRTHTVAAGDTLTKISQRYYGGGDRWQQIYAANREILGPQGQLKVGQVLRIP